jgi:hypothetical protein
VGAEQWVSKSVVPQTIPSVGCVTSSSYPQSAAPTQTPSRLPGPGGMAPLPRATPPGPAGPSWYTSGYGCRAIRKFSIVSRPSRMRCVSSDRFFRRKHALPLPWRTRGRAPRVSVRARSLPLPSGPYALCGVRLHADPPDAPPPASRCSRHPATHSSFPHRPRCNRWAGQGAAGRPIPSHFKRTASRGTAPHLLPTRRSAYRALACAIEGLADYVVTDDRRDLLPLKVVRLAGHAAIQIVSAAGFLRILHD